MAEELERLSRVVGKEGKITQRADVGEVSGCMGENRRLRQRADRRSGAPDQRNGPRHRRGGQGRPVQTMALEVEGRPLTGEFLRTAKTVNTMVEQLGCSPPK